MSDDVKQRVSVVDVDESFLETVAAGRQRMFSSEQERVCRELIAARKRIAELEAKSFGQTIIDSLEEFNDSLKCPPVHKLATSGPSITRPVPAVDAWVAWNGKNTDTSFRVDAIETIDGKTRIISGAASIPVGEFVVTGPSDRGPWRPIGEVR